MACRTFGTLLSCFAIAALSFVQIAGILSSESLAQDQNNRHEQQHVSRRTTVKVGGGLDCDEEPSPATSELEDPKMLQREVDALGRESYGYSDLGVPHAWTTKLTERVISHGNAALPTLVKALKSDDSHVAGQAAYCLRLMKSTAGIEAAKTRRNDFSRKSNLDIHDGFAMVALGDYIEELSQGRNNVEHDPTNESPPAFAQARQESANAKSDDDLAAVKELLGKSKENPNALIAFLEKNPGALAPLDHRWIDEGWRVKEVFSRKEAQDAKLQAILKQRDDLRASSS